MYYEDEESLQGIVIRLSTVCECSLVKSANKIVLVFFLPIENVYTIFLSKYVQRFTETRNYLTDVIATI